MGTINVNATASLSANGTSTETGNINWTPPALPAGATSWDSITISGTWSWNGKGNINYVSINGTRTTTGSPFSISLGANAAPPITITCLGGNKNATGNRFSWSGLRVDYSYSRSFTISSGPTTNGQIALSQSGLVKEGTTINVIGTPDDGYKLETVYVNGVAIPGTSFTVEGDSFVTATFVKQYTGLTIKENGAWTQTAKVYKKVSGVWVAQTDIGSLFDQNVKYIRKN